jgi:hypothetical protein
MHDVLDALRFALSAAKRAREVVAILSLNRQDTSQAERHLIRNGELLELAVDEFLMMHDRAPDRERKLRAALDLMLFAFPYEHTPFCDAHTGKGPCGDCACEQARAALALK